jgi:uncharacterized protein YeaO (DUF488 family)
VIQTKRAYDEPRPEDGTRFLVDRIWPRGVKKEDLQIEDWLTEAAPSDELRKWFGHETKKWPEFQERYFAELDDQAQALEPIREAADAGTVTLVYGARDTEHNNAVALKAYLEKT